MVTVTPLAYRAGVDSGGSIPARQRAKGKAEAGDGPRSSQGSQLWRTFLTGSHYLPAVAGHRAGSLETPPPLAGQLCCHPLGWRFTHQSPWGINLEHGANTRLSVTFLFLLLSSLPLPGVLSLAFRQEEMQNCLSKEICW